MRKSFVVVALLSLGACASNPGPSTTDGQTVRVVGPGGGELRVRPSADANLVIVVDSIPKVWAVMPAVYDSVGLSIDPNLMDFKTRQISSGTIKIRRHLGEAALSKYLDCGGTQIGPSADSYEIMLSVTTRLVPQPAGATGVSTVVEAAGKPINFAQAYTPCTSTGRLERFIGEVARIKAR
jgi:hypothetical protein